MGMTQQERDRRLVRPKLPINSLIGDLRFPTSEFQEGEPWVERSRNSKVSKFN